MSMTITSRVRRNIEKYNLAVTEIANFDWYNEDEGELYRVKMSNAGSGVRGGRTRNNRTYVLSGKQIRQLGLIPHRNISRSNETALEALQIGAARIILKQKKKKVEKTPCNKEKVCYTDNIIERNPIGDLEF